MIKGRMCTYSDPTREFDVLEGIVDSGASSVYTGNVNRSYYALGEGMFIGPDYDDPNVFPIGDEIPKFRRPESGKVLPKPRVGDRLVFAWVEGKATVWGYSIQYESTKMKMELKSGKNFFGFDPHSQAWLRILWLTEGGYYEAVNLGGSQSNWQAEVLPIVVSRISFGRINVVDRELPHYVRPDMLKHLSETVVKFLLEADADAIRRAARRL